MDGQIRIGTKIETKNFDKQIDELDNKARKLSIEIKKNKELKINTLSAEAELEKIQNKIAGLKNLDFSQGLKNTKNIEFSPSTIGNLTSAKIQYEGMNAKVKSIRGELPYIAKNIRDLKIETDKAGNSAGKIKNETNNIKNNFGSAFKSAKRLAIGIIGISSAYSLVRKASSSYLATDSATTNQIEANWTALGTILEPVITFITGLMKKAVTSILYFLSVLTGTDYIAKANANALKKQAQATNELTKANEKYSASFDEMDIMQSQTDSYDGSSSGIDTSVLFDVNDISEKTRGAIEKIAGALKPVYEMLKTIIGWALENPEAVLGILGGMALIKGLGSIIGVAGAGGIAGTGLAGIYGLLLGIMSIGVITISIKLMIDNFMDLQEKIEGAKKNIQGVTDDAIGLTNEVRELGRQANTSAEQLDSLGDATLKSAKSSIELVDIYAKEYTSMSNVDKKIASLTGRTGAIRQATKRYTNEAFAEIMTLQDLYSQGKLNDEQTKEYIDRLISFTDVVGQGGTSVEELTKTFGINRNEAEKMSSQYKTVSAMLLQTYYDSDKTSSGFSFLKSTMEKLPKSVQTTIESNVKERIDNFETVKNKIFGIPSYKQVTIETNVTANVDSARNTINSLFNKISPTITTTLKAFGINLDFPKLAVGGIVNNPGQGVPIGNVITGEAGREGVLPLTDPSTMQELGYEIGKWITVNATLNNYMNGRLLQREMTQMQKEKDFATNGRG